MKTLITYTKPEFIETKENGLNQYRYELHGLIEAVNYTVKKTVTDAIVEAKLVISKYIARHEIPLRKKKYITVEPSGWSGINYDQNKDKWRSTVQVDGKQIHIGHYIKKGTAINERRKANIKYGLPEFHGMKKISLN